MLSWDIDDPLSLWLVIQELLAQFGRYQQSEIKNNSRLDFEFNSLIESKQFKPEDIEVHIEKRKDVSICVEDNVVFLVKFI